MLSGGTGGIGATPQSLASLTGKVKREVGITGIANIPNQVHYLASHARVEFNILLMGDASLGKTGLVNRILGGTVFENIHEPDPQEGDSSSMVIRIRQQEVVDNDVHAIFRLIDAPQVGHSIRKEEGYRHLCEYTKDQLRKYLAWELSPKRAHAPQVDGRVHVCLYLLTPHQCELSTVDLVILKSISSHTSVIPVVAKADMLTELELAHLNKRVFDQCNKHAIPLFDPVTSLFASSYRGEVAKGLHRLEPELVRKYLPRLISDLELVHYERCRTAILQEPRVIEKYLLRIPPAMRLVVTKSPSEALALTNCIILNPADANTHLKTGYVLIGHKFILAARTEDAIGSGQAGFSSTHRNWMQLALGDAIECEPFDPLSYQTGGACFLERALFEVDVLRRTAQTALSFDTDRMAEVFATTFTRQPLTVGQPIVMDFGGHNLLLKVHSLVKVTVAPSSGNITATTIPQQEGAVKWGILLDKTELRFSRAPDSLVKLSGEHEINTNAIIQPDFKFEDMGIGGLDKEFWTIFRRAFSSRIYPQDLVQKLGIRHVKGLILYGPPGTGKTLMARQIAKMLHAREPKIINGPEILNKYVGQSEENIRVLFRDAELEYKSKGENSQLHIIIFDELDAICKQRGARQDNTGVGDSVVNQLLAKMDGVEQLNNILVIGMTNRLDMLDEALLRPGRFEVQLEISLPDLQGRHQILKIHTKTMRENDILAEDVDLEELAGLCKNFTGAEIVGLINSATSFALNRHIKVGNTVEVAKDAISMRVTRDDFLRALEEVHAAYGVSEDEFASCGQQDVVAYSDEMRQLLSQAELVIKQAASADRTLLSGILLYGSTGCGKTAIAAKLATESNFPFAKLLSTHTLVGLSELAKIGVITKIFMDAYKSQQSLVVVDDIEDLIDFVSIGPRFSSALLQTFRNFFKKAPPEGRRLVIVGTTRNKRLMDQLGISQHFRTQLHIPNVCRLEDFRALLYRNQSLLDEDQKKILEEVKRTLARGNAFSVPISTLRELFEIAAHDQDNPVLRFMDEFEAFIISGTQLGNHTQSIADEVIMNMNEA